MFWRSHRRHEACPDTQDTKRPECTWTWGEWSWRSFFCLLWIKKVRSEDKTYIWVSVRWNELIICYESIKRELKGRLTYEYRCDERLKTKTEESTHLTDNELYKKMFILFIIKSIKRELKTRPVYDCRCDERLEPKYDEFKCLAYSGLLEELARSHPRSILFLDFVSVLFFVSYFAQSPSKTSRKARQ